MCAYTRLGWGKQEKHVEVLWGNIWKMPTWKTETKMGGYCWLITNIGCEKIG
jgi:hypothetical protein